MYLKNFSIWQCDFPGSMKCPMKWHVRFGILGVGLDVQGSIALSKAASTGLHVRCDAIPEAISSMEQTRDDQALILEADSEARKAFALKNGKIQFEPNSLPRFEPARLAEWLQGRWRSLKGFDGFRLPGPSREDDSVSTTSEEWGILRECDPKIAAWSNLLRTSRNMVYYDHWNMRRTSGPFTWCCRGLNPKTPLAKRGFSASRTLDCSYRVLITILSLGDLKILKCGHSEPFVYNKGEIPKLLAF